MYNSASVFISEYPNDPQFPNRVDKRYELKAVEKNGYGLRDIVVTEVNFTDLANYVHIIGNLL
jgi:hypothetical protein